MVVLPWENLRRDDTACHRKRLKRTRRVARRKAEKQLLLLGAHL